MFSKKEYNSQISLLISAMLYETAVARLRYSYSKVGKEAVDKYYKVSNGLI